MNGNSHTSLKIVAGIIITLIVAGIVFFILARLNLLPTINRNQVKNPPNTSADKPSLSCPSEQSFCNQGKIVKYGGFDALAFILPKEAVVKSVADASDSQEFIAQDRKGVRQTFESEDICFTVTYTLASDAKIETLQAASVKSGDLLASVGAETLPNIEEKTNLLIQVQKIPISEIKAEQTQLPACSIINLKSQNFGQYVNLTLEDFK
ncbi:MAG TPA: hypothetical protein VJH97_06985 [Candidatus Nanoarchaeia archaeon]|nr:hypothetical protein [Candidatus Nanoarchaeia archaeon]